MPEGHLSHLPEVTFRAHRLAAAARSQQHGGMHSRLRRFLHPFNLAGLFAWAAVAMTVHWGDPGTLYLRWIAALLFLVAFFADEIFDRPATPVLWVAWIVQAFAALWLVWLAPRDGTTPVLLVMLIAKMAHVIAPRTLVCVAIVLNLAFYLILHQQGHPAPLTVTVLYAAFQAFAALTMHYARSAEEARDRLARVNADLLATRALLADSSRDAERLRVARELHDVAGRKLTALRLNLRALAADENAASQLQLAEQLSAELLGDIRGVVQALRDVDGLDIGTALRALAAPFPRPRLELAIDDAVHITNPALAETVLRLVQEALTNSARHADADTLRIVLSRRDDAIHLHIEDDGRLRGDLRQGNGLTGMRERIEERGGRIAFARNDNGALCINAELPA